MARQTQGTDRCNRGILDCYSSGVASNCRVFDTIQLDVEDLSSLPICDVT